MPFIEFTYFTYNAKETNTVRGAAQLDYRHEKNPKQMKLNIMTGSQAESIVQQSLNICKECWMMTCAPEHSLMSFDYFNIILEKRFDLIRMKIPSPFCYMYKHILFFHLDVNKPDNFLYLWEALYPLLTHALWDLQVEREGILLWRMLVSYRILQLKPRNNFVNN